MSKIRSPSQKYRILIDADSYQIEVRRNTPIQWYEALVPPF